MFDTKQLLFGFGLGFAAVAVIGLLILPMCMCVPVVLSCLGLALAVFLATGIGMIECSLSDNQPVFLTGLLIVAAVLTYVCLILL